MIVFFGSFFPLSAAPKRSELAKQSFAPKPSAEGFPFHTSEANWRSNRGWTDALNICFSIILRKDNKRKNDSKLVHLIF
jgi:hypothetical protein